ncbi:MAG: error-prone DNA polymerase [Bradymonadales bacterium]|nr:error-prone DNA polymerase [Bradymonadales bacterium]
MVPAGGAGLRGVAGGCLMYAELHTRSALSLLGGASRPEDLVERAAELGYSAVALTDVMDMGGVVRFAERARELGVQGILGAQILVADGERDLGTLVLLAEREEGYRRLCRLITRARMQGPRDRPRVQTSWLEEGLEGLMVLDGGFDGPVSRCLRAGDDHRALRTACWLGRLVVGGHLALEVYDHLTHEERRLSAQIDALGEQLGIPRVVTGDVRFARREEKPLYDLLTSVRHRIPLAEMGSRLLPSGEWCLQPLEVLGERWQARPDLLERSARLAERLVFRFESLRPKLPHFPIPDRFREDDQFLAHLVWEGAHRRYPELSERHRRQIEHELQVIRSKGMAGYFLISWDINLFCRQRGILAQGRGSAANSAVCYCLGITAVDPIAMELLFERFLSEEREGYPDIDIDIAHEWREEVIQYVYRRYGREHAALVCEQICYRPRSAVRDAAWALGFEPEQADRLARQMGHLPRQEIESWMRQEGCRAAGVVADDPRMVLLARLVEGLQGLPRHRSIHVGGMILTADPLCEIVPIEPASMPDRTVVQWEKDDLPYSGLAKFDLLGLGMLSVLQKALGTLGRQRGEAMDLASIPPEDPAVYEALCRADSVGVFQIESSAQRTTLPRMKPRRFYDLVVEIALIRPGPLQGNMVHPYLRRRNGEEPVTYLHPDLEPILKRTLGIPMFQEQVMKIAIELGGFTPAQSDELRRAMGFRRYSPRIETLREALVEGMSARGIDGPSQEKIIRFLLAFSNYGFPESHSASFALLCYASAWLKVHQAPLFTACLINSQPMGFYSNATLIQDARLHGVECRPPDLRHSAWDCTLETAMPGGRWPRALRIGLRCIEGLGNKARQKLEQARQEGPFQTLREVVVRTGLTAPQLARLARAGAFDGFLGQTSECERRRQALWAVLKEGRVPADSLDRFSMPELPVAFEPMSRQEQIVCDYLFAGLCTHGHAMEPLRPRLDGRRVLSAVQLKRVKNGSAVRTAGMIIARQRPRTAKGFAFLTLEDETGLTHIILTPPVFERNRAQILSATFCEIHGTAQVQGNLVQIKARRFYPLDAGGVPVVSHDFH